MLSPLPRRSDWASVSLIPSSRISLPRKGCRVGLRIVLFEACSAFTRVAACTLALSPMRADCPITSDAAEKLVGRLQKNRYKMFTFLDFDDVSWNNNNAEHAVKAFASVRRVIEGPTTENGLREFLVLLSICETCKCKNVEFLEFLRSGAKDIDEFATSRRGQRVRRARQRTDRHIEA